MKIIQKLLVPTDLSENARRGLLYACSLAAENNGISMAEKLEADQLRELKRIEIAVESAAEKIRQLKSLVRDYLPSHEDRIRP